MRAPLENEAGVPEGEDGENEKRGGKSGAAGMEELSGAIEENSEAENEERRERNEKAVAVGRDAGPIGVTRDEKIKSQQSSEERSADARHAPAEENQSNNREKKDGGPDKQAVVGSEEHVEKGRGAPEPVSERDVARF